MAFKSGDPVTVAAGRKGGRVTVERYGRPHMQALGRRGFAIVKSRRCVDAQGNVWDPYTWLLWKLGYVTANALPRGRKRAG
jgi:hypothetical protein